MYNIRQGDPDRLQEVQLTLVPSDRAGLVMVVHGEDNAGICMVTLIDLNDDVDDDDDDDHDGDDKADDDEKRS